MSVKLETPVYKTEVVKVSNMNAVDTLNDESLFLVIQDGFAHKITAKTLKDSIYSFAQKQLNDFFKSYLIKQRDTKKEFSELSSLCVDTVESLGKSLQRKITLKHKENVQYFENAINDLSSSINQNEEIKFKEFEKDFNEKSKMTANALNLQVSNLVGSLSAQLETMFLSKISTLSTSIDANIDILTKVIDEQLNKNAEKLDTSFSDFEDVYNKTISEISNNTQQSTGIVASLSIALEDIDKKLYGLTVEEIDDKHNIVNHTLLSGDISTLSSEIRQLNEKYELLTTSVNELKDLITK